VVGKGGGLRRGTNRGREKGGDVRSTGCGGWVGQGRKNMPTDVFCGEDGVAGEERGGLSC